MSAAVDEGEVFPVAGASTAQAPGSQQSPAQAAVDRVYVSLRKGILDGTYPQGTRLGEVDLADAFGVSRTPVREALRRLGSEGLLSTLPNKGARVRTWSDDEIEDIFDLRALLEGHAAALAASRISDSEALLMGELVARMEACTDDDDAIDIDVVTELNGAFHAAIVTASGNSLLPDFVNSLVHVPVVMRTYRCYSPARMRQSMRQHREVLEALTTGDSAWAEAIMRAHILSARPVLLGGRAGSAGA